MVKKTDAEVYKLAEQTAKAKFQWCLLTFLLQFFDNNVKKPSEKEKQIYKQLKADLDGEQEEVTVNFASMKADYPPTTENNRKNLIFNIAFHATLLKLCLNYDWHTGASIFKNRSEIDNEYLVAFKSDVDMRSKQYRSDLEIECQNFDDKFVYTNSRCEAKIIALKKQLGEFEEPRIVGTSKSVFNSEKVFTKVKFEKLVSTASDLDGGLINAVGFMLYAVATLPFGIVQPMGQAEKKTYSVAEILDNAHTVIPEKECSWCNWSNFARADLKYFRANQSINDAAYDFQTKTAPAPAPAGGGSGGVAAATGKIKAKARAYPERQDDEVVTEYFARASKGLYTNDFVQDFQATCTSAFNICCNVVVNPSQLAAWKKVDDAMDEEQHFYDGTINYIEFQASKMAEAEEIDAALCVINTFEDFQLFLPAPTELTFNNYAEVASMTNALFSMGDTSMVDKFRCWIHSKDFKRADGVVSVIERALGVSLDDADDDWFDETTLSAFMKLSDDEKDTTYNSVFPVPKSAQSPKAGGGKGAAAAAPKSPSVSTKEDTHPPKPVSASPAKKRKGGGCSTSDRKQIGRKVDNSSQSPAKKGPPAAVESDSASPAKGGAGAACVAPELGKRKIIAPERLIAGKK